MIFFVLIWSLSTLGFFALASGMDKHQKSIFSHHLTSRQTMLFKIVGWILLLLSLIISLYAGHISNMISYWIGVLTFAALYVGLTLSYKAEWSKKIAWLLFILSIVFGIIYFN